MRTTLLTIGAIVFLVISILISGVIHGCKRHAAVLHDLDVMEGSYNEQK